MKVWMMQPVNRLVSHAFIHLRNNAHARAREAGGHESLTNQHRKPTGIV